MVQHDVVCAALTRQGRILLVHRSASNDWYPDVWDLPGGHVEPMETGAQTAVRELQEELGVSIAEPSDPPITEVRLDDMVLRIWRIDAWVGEVLNRASDEHDALGWFDAAGLRTLELASLDYRPLFERLLRDTARPV